MDEVAQVKSRLEITEVVGQYLPLKQAGRNLKAPCPFHNEKSASFMVSPERGIFHCFGCSESGDIFNFVMKMEGLEFREALEKLARQAGVELQARRGEDGALKKQRERLYEAHRLAAQYFHACLVKNRFAAEYVVRKRRLNKETIRGFQIGYAPDSWNALTDFLAKRGYSPAELLAGGLAGQKQGRTTVYDLFRGRIMFTISDREGRPVGFTGRVLDDSAPKYLNTPQTPLYDKSHVIFGLHLAKDAIRRTDEVVLVEGNMDVIASHQAGVCQVVAASGTALTIDQLRSLSKITKNVKLAFDSDRAGLAATERVIEMGQKLGLTLRMIEMPDGVKDADELIQSDPELWRAAIAGSKYIIDYLFDRFERDYDLSTSIGKRQYADRLAACLRRLGDPVERDHYVKRLAAKVGVSEEAVNEKLDTPEASGPGFGGAPSAGGANPGGSAMGRATPATSAPEPPRAKSPANRRPTLRQNLERLVLAMAASYPDTRVVLNELTEESFETPKNRELYRALAENREIPPDQLGKQLTELENDINILLLVGERQYAEVAPADRSIEAFELTRRLQNLSNIERKRALIDEIKLAEQSGDLDRVKELYSQIQTLNEEEI